MMNGTPPPAVRRDTESKNGTHARFFGALLARTRSNRWEKARHRATFARVYTSAPAAAPAGAVGQPTRGRHADIRQLVFFEERA